MNFLDVQALGSTPVERDPFDWLMVRNFVSADALKRIGADFPQVPGPGSHPPSELEISGAFKQLIDELHSPELKTIIERKFDVDLSNRPTMYTVRGYISDHDGGIHTDSKTKIITVLLYLNDDWKADGGRLRILRNGRDLEDYVAEVPPEGGVLLVFKRSDKSWHGHKKHVGQRRVLQLNWVLDQSVVDREQNRHRFSTRIKKLKRLVFGSSKAA